MPTSPPESEANDDARTTTLYRALLVAPSVRARLEGASMGPLFASGIVADVIRCTRRELGAGDVAVYVRGGRVLAHLVRRVGDSGPVPASLGSAEEPPIPAHSLIGRVRGIVVGRVHVERAPRILSRFIVLGVDSVVRMRSRLSPSSSRSPAPWRRGGAPGQREL